MPWVARIFVFLTAPICVAILLGGGRARAGGSARGECAPGNVMEHAPLARWIDTTGATALLTDGSVVPEGARWPSQGVTFTSRAGSLTYDLGSEPTVGGLYFQGEGVRFRAARAQGPLPKAPPPAATSLRRRRPQRASPCVSVSAKKVRAVARLAGRRSLEFAHKGDPVHRRLLGRRRQNDDLRGADRDIVRKLHDSVRGDRSRESAPW
jgi:hypothetical protein